VVRQAAAPKVGLAVVAVIVVGFVADCRRRERRAGNFFSRLLSLINLGAAEIRSSVHGLSGIPATPYEV
jgi:hypothetical protein